MRGKISFLSISSLIILQLALHNCFDIYHERAYELQTGTWNMQGAQRSGSDRSKWAELAFVLALQSRPEQRLDVVGIQEAGARPSTAVESMPGEPGYPEVRREGTSSDIEYEDTVREFTWQVSTNSRTNRIYSVYHCATEIIAANRGRLSNRLFSQRVNVAIVSLVRADEIILFRVDNENRPGLCIRVGSRFFCSIHAAAYNANRSPVMVQSMENYFHERRVETGTRYSWMILADFNRNPDTYPLQPIRFGMHRRIVTQTEQTHDNGRVYDFAIAGSTDDTIPDMQALLDTSLRSDHTFVRFYSTAQPITTARPIRFRFEDNRNTFNQFGGFNNDFRPHFDPNHFGGGSQFGRRNDEKTTVSPPLIIRTNDDSTEPRHTSYGFWH